MTHTDVHWSGLVTATDEQWTHFAHKVGASEATTAAFTECRVELDLGADWDQYRPAHPTVAECRVAWRKSDWGVTLKPSASGYRYLDTKGFQMLTTSTFANGAGKRPGVAMTWVLLDHVDTDVSLLRAVAHLPASVEHGDKFRARSKRVVAYQSALLGLRREIRALKKQHRPDHVILSCDWNVDFRRRSWRLAIAAALKGTGLHLVPPTTGTHGDRAIDAHAITRPLRHHVKVLPALHPFDHRGVELTLTADKGAEH